MAWASSGGYPGVASDGSGGLTVSGFVRAAQFNTPAFGSIVILDAFGNQTFTAGFNGQNGGITARNGIGLFQKTPPAAATVGGAATAGGTYTATEEAMLNAAYTALRSIGLIT